MSQGQPGTEYVPRRGSACDLALQQLRAHGRMGRDALASAIDKPGDEVRALLAFPIRLGAILTGLEPDGKCWYEAAKGRVMVPPPAAANGYSKAGDAPPISPAKRLQPAHVEGAGHAEGRPDPAAEDQRSGSAEAEALTWHGCPEESGVMVRDHLGSVSRRGIKTPNRVSTAIAGVASGPLHPSDCACLECATAIGSPPVEKPEVDEPALQQLVQLLDEEPDDALIRGGDIGRRAPESISRLWVALGSDGCLVIRRGGKWEVFDREETREIARYFSAIGVEAWGCA